MQVVGLNDLLPSGLKMKKIQTGSELLLAYELGKYAKTMLNQELVLNDITVVKELLTSFHFSFVYTNGLRFGFEVDKSKLRDYSKSVRLFFTNSVEGVAFKSVTDEEVVYDFNHDTDSNMILHKDNRSAGYISLLAYLIIKAKSEGKPTPTLVIDHKEYLQQELEYVDLLILMNYGSKVAKDLLRLELPENWALQPDWEAYVWMNRQLGHMVQEYSITDKFKTMKKTFEVGDVVLMYSRSKTSKGRSIARLISCFPAVVRYYDGTTLRLEYYPVVQTKLTRKVGLDEVTTSLEEEGKESIYRAEDYEQFVTCVETFDLTEIGVGTATFSERKFIIEPLDFDGSYQWLSGEKGASRLWMSTLDTIYAVFENRGVVYNKDRFIQKYFAPLKREPVYEEYRVYN